ncbi:cell division protein ZapA [Lapidilactobacillus achengensis]|uniref:Cell division protein ZapA n=1 Tax=Lapidilactobacillus achengensis TaxID=2486000 RepID=A0ABW1UL00_9LACO|nr:cell division protein ZapA [Lapidilactobacillus achengensis]
MAKQNQPYKAVINHREYQIIGPRTPEQMAQITQRVNEQLQALKRQDPLLSSEDAAVLLAFNLVAQQLAHENLQAKRRKK